MSNTARLAEIMECFARGDLEGVLAFYDDAVEFDIQAPEGFPVTGLRKGKEQLRRVFLYNASQLDDHRYEVRHTMEEGDTTLSRGFESGTVRATGRQVAFPVIAEHRWRDGKIVFWREYYDTAQFYDDLERA